MPVEKFTPEWNGMPVEQVKLGQLQLSVSYLYDLNQYST